MDNTKVDPIAGVQGLDEANDVARLNSQINKFSNGLEVDLSTPKDGHCLFHALNKGGIASLSDCPCSLTIDEMRGMALARATRQQLEMAASCTRSGVSVEE